MTDWIEQEIVSTVRQKTAQVAEQQLSKTPRSVWLALALALLVFLVHVAAVSVLHNETDLATVDNIFDVVEGFLATVILFFAATQCAKVSRRLAIAWGIIGAAMLCYTLGDALWALIESVLGQDPFPSIADAGYLLYYPLLFVGLFVLPTMPLDRSERNRLFVDIGIVMVSMTMLYMRFLFAPLFNDSEADRLMQVFTLVYPVFDLVLIWGVVSIMLRRTENTSMLLVLAMSALALGIADSLFNYEQITNTVEERVVITETLYALAPLLAALAGGLQVLALRDTGRRVTGRSTLVERIIRTIQRTQRIVSVIMPYLWVGLAFFLLLLEFGRPHPNGPDSELILNIIGMGLTLILVLIRQTQSAWDNTRLSTRLSRLVDVSRILSEPISGKDLPPLILKQAKELLDYDSACILLLHEQDTSIGFIHRYQADRPDGKWLEPERMHMPEAISGLIKAGRTQVISPPYVGWNAFIAGVLGNPPAVATELVPPIACVLIVPIIVNQNPIGLLAMSHSLANHFTLKDADAALSFAHQAGAALENARLRRQEATAAAQAERSRLARELHDSVSQALFGIALGARTTRELIQRDPAKATEAMDYVLNLADGAQAEMKALIFELRPETLATEGLIIALRKQSDALCKRHGLQATFNANCPEPEAPLHIKEALYRIAMEAIQNTIRHAQATRVCIQLQCGDNKLALTVQDNGRGFDTNAKFAGHYGLHTMRERAEQIGATLSVKSAPSVGTTIHIDAHL